MLQVEFDLNQNVTMIQANSKDSFKDAINKFVQKSLINPDSAYFIANGNIINPEKSIESQMTELNKKNNKIKVLINITEEEKKEEEKVFIKSNDIICPQCQEPCRIKIEDNFKIKLYDCVNNHITNNINLKDFKETQNINISKIICGKCKIKNKGNTTNNEFYRCLTCNMNLCILCKTNHDQTHNLINYEQKNYICQKHSDSLIKYCKKCNLNICYSCEEEHANHETIFLGELKPDLEGTKKVLLDMKSKIDLFNKNIEDIIEQLKDLINTMNTFYEINNNIFNKYKTKNRNFQVLQNLKEINLNNEIIQKLNINKIINKDDIFSFLNTASDNVNIDNKENIKIEQNDISKNEKKNKEEKINQKNQITSSLNNYLVNNNGNQLTIIYNINKNKKSIKLFGEKFVENNKNLCYISVDGEKIELCEYLTLNDEQRKKETLEIKLIKDKRVTSLAYMFNKCNSLKSLPDISLLDTSYVINMEYIFSYIYLETLPDISKLDTSNITNMTGMFLNCEQLKELPDISKWDTSNVTDMSFMFYGCGSLKELPDISRWKISKVTNMYSMFKYCRSLESFPDCSNWEINKQLFRKEMFQGVNEKIIPKKFKGCLIF